MRFLLFGRSIGLKEKNFLKKLVTRTLGNRRPGTPASLLWSLGTTGHEPKINMAEKVVGVFVKLRQHGKKDQPPEPYAGTLMRRKNGLSTSLIFFFFFFGKCQNFGSVGRR